MADSHYPKNIRPRKKMAPVSEELSRSMALRERRNNFLKKESKRLKTFAKWPVSFLRASDLAKDGFYFTNIDDVVKCAFCKTQIGFWEEGDDPHKDHLRLSPNCPFLKNEPCGNIPLSEDQDDQEEDENLSQDVCGLYPLQIRPFSGPERPNKGAFSIDSSNLWKDFENLGISKIREPIAPNFATYESRLRTFEKWTAQDTQSPEKLAEAGFYYTGEEDNVLCFHCGGGLKKWEKGEDPWVEHARWFHKCHFVILQKGREFIHGVLLKEKPVLTAETLREIMNSKRNSDNDISTSRTPCPDTQCDPKPKSSTSENTASPCCSSKSQISASRCVEKTSSSEAKEIQLCIICCTREREVVFLPCGHFACCFQCTSSLNKCTVCRDPFQAIVRAYLS